MLYERKFVPKGEGRENIMNFSNEKWIVSKMIEKDPITFEFEVKCLSNWDDIKKEKSQNHFVKFQLNNYINHVRQRNLQDGLMGLLGYADKVLMKLSDCYELFADSEITMTKE